MTGDDAKAVRHLWSARFGGEPGTQQHWIDAALSGAHSAAGLVAVAPPGETIVGLSLLDVGSRSYTRRYLGLNVLDHHPSLADRNGILHLSCVRVHWEGCGIGTAFYDRRMALLRQRGVPRVFGIAWHRSPTMDSRELFEKKGFDRLATVEHFYERTGGRRRCPDCGTPCACTASLYGRSVS